MSDAALKRRLADYLLSGDRMVVDLTPEMMRLFPMQTPPGDEAAWLKAVAALLQGATELRRPSLPGGKFRLAVKDRAVLFNYTQDRTLEDMAKERKANA